jgi:hypothetical protein
LIPLGVILELLILKTNQLLFFWDFIALVASKTIAGALFDQT